jgi:hypothetical protein
MRAIGIAAGLALLAASSASALAAPKKGDAGYDPQREICKSRSVVGSRVQRVRECHTVLEWEELKMQERMGLLRKQVNGDPGCPEAISCGDRAGARDTPW